MSHLKPTLCALLLFLMIAGGPAGASLIVHGTQANDAAAPGSSLSDVQMSVDLTVTGGTATVTFANVSVPPELSAVFKTIYLDLTDDDTGTGILWLPNIRHDLSDGTYSVQPYSVMPGYGPEITDGSSMIEFEAAVPPTGYGLGVGGDTLVVEFATSLADGSDIFDYLAAFNGGDDTEHYSIGFHAVSADTVSGRSLTGVNVPEPAALGLIALGAVAMLKRKRTS